MSDDSSNPGPEEEATNTDESDEELTSVERSDDFVETHAAGYGYQANGDQFVLEFWKPDLTFQADENNQVQEIDRTLVSGSRVFMTTNTAYQLYKSLDGFFEDVDTGQEDDEQGE